MAEVEFQLHNEVGIKFPPLRPVYTDGELYFGRFIGLVARSTGTSCIGEGGTGRIHLVRDELMEREVALKIPLDSIQRDPAAREDVIQETRQAMDLTHPNIVRIHDFHEGAGKWGISMQYVRGKNLDEWRYENETSGFRRTIRPYTVEAIRDWVAQLCDALRYAHEDARMVHRDIKPKNLMLEKRDGREKIYITDFGISQRLRQHTMMLSRDQSKVGESKGNMGTLPYMPWEQISGAAASPLDDIYAVGATIYELITGRPPFYDGGFEQIKVQIREVPPPSMEQRILDLGMHMPPPPQEWEEIVAACLAKRPEDRPQSMRAVAAALGFQSGSNIELEAIVSSQAERIDELETRIITINQATSPVVDSGALDQLAELQKQIDFSQENGTRLEQIVASSLTELEELASRLKAAEAERDAALKGGDQALQIFQEDSAKRIAAAEEKVTNLQKQLDAAIASGGDLVTQARQADQQKIAELDSKLQGTKKETELAISAATEKLKREAEQLAEKLKKTEQTQEKTINQVREEADKRLQKQAEELEKLRQQWKKEQTAVEQLERTVAVEKERQGASLRPVLISFCAAVVLGLLGGFIYAKPKSSPANDTLAKVFADTLPEQENTLSAEPVSYSFFEQFAKEMGTNALELGALPGDKGEVTHVSAIAAMNFCNWLNGKKHPPEGMIYSLPNYDELKKYDLTKKEWTDDWFDQKVNVLKVYDGKIISFVHSAHAGDDITFRVALESAQTNPPAQTSNTQSDGANKAPEAKKDTTVEEGVKFKNEK